MKKIAIIGASTGQISIYKKAKEMGLFVIGFAWEKGAVCKKIADKFYDISILEMERIVEICNKEEVSGVVSNASELTAQVVSYVSEKLHLHGNIYNSFLLIQDKYYVRSKTNDIQGLSKVNCFKYEKNIPLKFPCIVKPRKGKAKVGISVANNIKEFEKAIEYAEKSTQEEIIIEEYVEGREFSVESLSFEGRHYVLQITDKDTTGAPHFVEIGHHEPSMLDDNIKTKIYNIIPEILSKVNYENGASHIEFRIDTKNNIHLIEINPRGGGGEISNHLVELSTGYDYLRGMIEVALGEFAGIKKLLSNYAGIYYLCKQNEEKSEFFNRLSYQPWLKIKNIHDVSLKDFSSNYDRNTFFIYQWDKKIECVNSNLYVQKLNNMPNAREMAIDFIHSINIERNNDILKDEWVDKILKFADILCIIQNNKIIAWFVLYCNDYVTKKAYGAGLHVLKPYRKKGYGQKLLEYVISICKIRNFNNFFFYCDNPIAINMYLKNGFEILGQEHVPSLQNKLYSLINLKL